MTVTVALIRGDYGARMYCLLSDGPGRAKAATLGRLGFVTRRPMAPARAAFGRLGFVRRRPMAPARAAKAWICKTPPDGPGQSGEGLDL